MVRVGPFLIALVTTGLLTFRSAGLAGEVQTLRSAGLNLIGRLYSGAPDSVPTAVVAHALWQLSEIVSNVVMRAPEDGSSTALALVRSHYPDADLGRVVEGFASGYSDEQLDVISVETLEPRAKVVADFKTEDARAIRPVSLWIGPNM